MWLASSSSTSHSTRGILNPTQPPHPNSATAQGEAERQSCVPTFEWGVVCAVCSGCGVVWEGEEGQVEGGQTLHLP